MDILILHIMKYCIAIFTFALYAHCCAQFIPQPMGYNPDENSDGLIGVGDLQGLLALYGNTFDSGDSLVVEFDTWDVNLPYGNGEDDYVMNSGIDLLYLSSNLWDDNEQFILPPTTGFRTLMIALTLTECCTIGGEVEFLTNQSNPFSEVISLPSSDLGERSILLFVHGHDGEWYFVGPR